MKKIPNLFERDWNGDKSRVLPVLNTTADVEWVLRGEGVPTVKWDGSACMVRDGKLYVRYDAKGGKTPPVGFEPAQEADPKTGHRPGWIPAYGNPAAKWHLDAFMNCDLDADSPLADGTYEACGPQHQSNPYELAKNILIRHGAHELGECDAEPDIGTPALWHRPWRDAQQAFELLHDYLLRVKIEGIVFHHPDGRMVKVLASDLGLQWKAKSR